jgi:hypothetical protein
MVFSGRRFLGVAGLAALSFQVLASPEGPRPPALGSAVSFAILGGSAVTNARDTIVAGNVGVSPGNTITGFSSQSFSIGGVHRNDSLARAAHRDAAAAYDDLAGRTCNPGSIDPILGGTTRTAGVYCFGSDARLEGVLTLDAGGNRDAVWIFKVPGALTVVPGASVVVINGGYDGNVDWQVGTTATLGEESALKGNILARTSITLNRGASLSGRALAEQGPVTLDDNDVSLCCAPITVMPTTLPNGIAGTPYSLTLAATGGTESFRFTTTTTPAWLSLTGNVLSGVPVAGVSTFTVTATDTVTGCTGGRTYTINICPITILPETLPKGVAGRDYREALGASGGSGSYEFLVTSQPAGWHLTFEENVLSGDRPVVAGSFTFTVGARDLVTGCTASRTYMVIVDPCSLTVLPPSLPKGTKGVEYPEIEFTAIGSEGSNTFVAGETPAGLTFDSPFLYGTPAMAGVYPLTVTATNAVGCSGLRDYTIIVCPATLSPEILPPGTVGTPYKETIVFSGGTSPQFSYEGSLPPGLALDGDGALTGTAGTLAGTPTAAGRYCFTVAAVDANACSSKRDYCVDVVCPAIVLSPPALPGARVGQPYDHTVVAGGGTPPYTFSVTPDPLPNGLVATPAPDGTSLGIKGPATAPGDVGFVITAMDLYGCTVSQPYTIHVTVPPTGNGVPALSLWALLTLSVLLGAAAMVMLARRGG